MHSTQDSSFALFKSQHRHRREGYSPPSLPLSPSFHELATATSFSLQLLYRTSKLQHDSFNTSSSKTPSHPLPPRPPRHQTTLTYPQHDATIHDNGTTTFPGYQTGLSAAITSSEMGGEERKEETHNTVAAWGDGPRVTKGRSGSWESRGSPPGV